MDWLTGCMEGRLEFPVKGIHINDLTVTEKFKDCFRTGDIRYANIIPEQEEFILKTLKRSSEDYLIRVMTYHRAKGKEADASVILTDVCGKMLESVYEDIEAARRNAFVAITRSKWLNLYYEEDRWNSKNLFMLI